MAFSLKPSYGSHPTASLELSSSSLSKPDTSECTLNLYYSLPPELFVDTYELANYHASYAFHHWGSRDLEAPVSKVGRAGSGVLLVVKEPTKDELVVDMPLHTRYGLPSKEGYTQVNVNAPDAFWACPAESSSGAYTFYTPSYHIADAICRNTAITTNAIPLHLTLRWFQYPRYPKAKPQVHPIQPTCR